MNLHEKENYQLINSPKATGPDSESSPSHSRAQALNHLPPPLLCSVARLLQSKTHLLVQTLHYQLGNLYLHQLLRSAMCPSWESSRIREANCITQVNCPQQFKYRHIFQCNKLYSSYLFKICSNFINRQLSFRIGKLTL